MGACPLPVHGRVGAAGSRSDRCAAAAVKLRLYPFVVGLAVLFAVGVGRAQMLTARLNHSIALNRATIAHLCALTAVTDQVWRSAIRSYASLPNKTPDQALLLAELRRGHQSVQRDTSCTKIQS